MPIHEFHCPKCKSKFELKRPFSSAGEGASCPECNTDAQRIFSPFIAFDRFAKVEEGQSPIAGTMGSSGCSSCASSSCSSCN